MTLDTTHKIMLDGFGGQGVISAGKFLATAAMNAGLACSFLPSYGAEVRGGTSHCEVIVAAKPVRSPLIETPTALILFCRESYDGFAPRAVTESLVIYNASLVPPPSETAAPHLAVEAQAIAEEVGNPRGVNMVLAGVWLGAEGLIPAAVAEETVRTLSPPRLQPFVEKNILALRRGREIGEQFRA